MARELFTNRASTTVSTGGTDAPASGTEQTWTVFSSNSFPAAVSASTQFHIVDPAQQSEIIRVTNVSGTSWTVIRGAEGTTPVEHASGFTIRNVVVASWLQSVANMTVNVKDYGAVGDGEANDSPAFSAALAAAPSGSTVYFPSGIYKLDSVIATPTAGVAIRGSGPYSIIKAGSLSSGSHMVTLNKSDTTISDLTLDANNTSGVRMLWIGATSTKRYRVERVHFKNGISYGIRGGAALDDVQIRDCRFYDMVGTSASPMSLQGAAGSRDITISGCSFRNVGSADTQGSVALQVYGGSTNDIYTGVSIVDNHFDVNAFCIPVEPTGCTDLVVSGNVISGQGRRGITTGYIKRFVIANNVVKGNSVYFCEFNKAAQGVVTGNTSVDNEVFVRGTSTIDSMTDVVISGNTVRGATPSASSGVIDDTSGGTMVRVSIIGNTFIDCLDASGDATPTRSIIRTTAATGSSDIVIRGNTMYATAATAITRFVQCRSATRVQVSNNTCIITRNIPSPYTNQVIGITVGTSGSGVLIEGNYINCTGTNSASNWNAISQNGSGAYDGVHIHRNFIEGNFNNEILVSGITGTPAVNSHDNE